MSTSRVWPNGQQWLYDFMQRLLTPDAKKAGNHVFGNVNGVCFGIAAMAVSALLLDQIEVFDQRLVEMYALYLQQATSDVTIEMLAFLNGVEIYNQPYAHANLFAQGAMLQQEADVAITLLAPDKIQHDVADGGMGGMSVAAKLTGVYTEQELSLYFHNLQQASKDTQQTVSFILRNADHAIAVGYHAVKKVWYLIDANHFPVSCYLTSDDVAKAVHAAFGNEKHTVMSASLYTTNKHAVETQQCLAQLQTEASWNQLQQITPEKARRRDSKGATWLTLAIERGDAKAAYELIKNKADVNAAVFASGATPLWLAAIRGNDQLAAHLLNHGADINKSDNDGVSALHVAIEKGNHAVVKALLANNKIDVNKKRSQDGGTPLHVAVIFNRPEIAGLLLQAGAKLTLARRTDNRTPLQLATHRGLNEIANLLIQKQSQPANKGKSGFGFFNRVTKDYSMARGGIEPSTQGFSVPCSTN